MTKGKLFRALLLTLFLTFLLSLSSSSALGEAKVKYVFLFIGDGMGEGQRALAHAFYGKLVMNDLPVQGFITTQPLGGRITDSAASATALATGKKVLNGFLSVDSSDFSKLTTLAEVFKARGIGVGIVTNTPIDDATPAAFYSHQRSRLSYYEISLDMIRSGFDYFAGGSPLGNHERYRKRRPDILSLAKANGYRVVRDKVEAESLKAGAGKVMIFDQGAALYYEIDRPKDTLSLADLTRKAIELLYGPHGFFIMVEGGKIDWACHANDALTAIAEVKALDEAVEEALEFLRKHPEETLIVVTADHECGGMRVDLSGERFRLLKHQTMSYARFNRELSKGGDIVGLVKRAFGLNLTESEIKTLGDEVGSLALKLIRILNERAGINWGTRGHTDAPVPISAIGVGAQIFSGFYDNTEVPMRIIRIVGLTF